MDNHFAKLKDRWFAEAHENVGHEKFINTANEWFKGSKVNDIKGFENFQDIDVIIGCTQFIESFCLKNAWNVQVLPFDYSFYAVMGKHRTRQFKTGSAINHKSTELEIWRHISWMAGHT